MGYLQELLQTQQQTISQQRINNGLIGLDNGQAYSQFFPTWEVTAPQYQVPAAWSLTQLGYKTNEVAYACISLKMKTVSEAPLRIYDKVEQEFIDDGDNEEFYRFMEMPCPDISETDFHAANQMYLDIAGFMAWEKDTSNDGSLLSIWPIMPQYASFLRGQGQLLRAIHYLPYTGLPAYDIDRNRVVLMMMFDPQYFGLKPLSPTAVMADIIKVDNDMTTLIYQFLKNGTFADGLLKTDQIISEADAAFARQRWQEGHGGVNNAGQVAVLGKGLEYQRSSTTFREMVFPEVDARSETRICMGYSVPPILVSAKSGMDRATYSNYEQARKAWYEEYVTSQWKFLSERYTKDILPHFDANTNHILKFDTKDVKALQEDRNNQWKRAEEAYKARIIVRNQALIEMGLEQIGDSDPLTGNEYYQTAMTQTSMSTQDDLDTPNNQEPSKADVEVTGQDIAKVEPVKKPVPTKSQMDDEEKKFRAFAKRRLKENKSSDISEYEFIHLDEKRQRQLKSEYGVADPDAQMVLEALMETIKAINLSQPHQPNFNITANIQPGNTPNVTVENKIPEQKQIELPKISLPAPIVNVEVNPTPIINEVNTPRVKREIQTVKRDGGNNIEGTTTEMEYE